LEPKKWLGADQRIRRQTTFKHLVEKGSFARGEFFYLWVVRRRESGRTTKKMKPMIGIAVSRKTDPRAVGRNIWRRRVKEIFRTRQAELFQDVACFVKIRSSAKKTSYAAMEADLVRLFKKAGVWA
jgi:ribonuclease P protein component